MKILVIDPKAFSLDWSMRCQNAGHKVKWYCTPDKHTDNIGKGIIERVYDPREAAPWSDIIFYTDCTKWIDALEPWRKKGWPIIGASCEAADLELDRGKGQAALKKAGVDIAESKVFSDYDSAIAHVKKTMKRFVSKPNGDADKALSYCSKSPADMVFMLERWKKLSRLKGAFILQEFVPGIEMAVGAWFGPGGFNRGWCENFEFKKLMNDDMGVATGEQGTVLTYTARSRLANRVLKPLEEALDRLKYCGYVDINCIIDEDGNPIPLEFTMRPGWPTFNIQQSLHTGDPAEWLMDLTEGRDGGSATLGQVATGVVLTIPDYPYSKLTAKETMGIPVYGIEQSMQPWIHPCEMMMGEAPFEEKGKIANRKMMVTAGDYILVVSSTGKTVSQSKASAYNRLKKISMPNSPMYRTDIGNRLKKQLPMLHAMGYATSIHY